jgi:SAM-dependent methyltransferase
MDMPGPSPHDVAAPSDWVVRWTPLLPPGAAVLDVACGHGRHVHWLADAGHRVTAIDREPALLAPLAGRATTLVADLEADAWPLPGRQFDAVLVTNYLWRALFPALLAAVAPGGLLIYETFAQAHAALGRPRRPEFLLRPGELIAILKAPPTPTDESFSTSEEWHVVAFEEGRLPARGGVPEREVQRIVARHGAATPGRADLLASPS